MRQFVWYKEDGSLGGEVTSPGGFAADVDLDGERRHELAAQTHALQVEQNPDLVGWVATTKNPADLMRFFFVDLSGDTPVLRERPAATMLLDGQAVEVNDAEAPYNYPAGRPMSFKLTADVPDGVAVKLARARGGSNAYLAQLPRELTFTGGETEEIQIRVPTFGLSGGLGFYHQRWVQRGRLWLLGWE